MFLLKSTRLRRKLLSFMFSHVAESHYVRELAMHIDEDPGNLSRELRALEDEGVFNSTVRGNLKFYSVNKSYPLFNELKKLIRKSAGLQKDLADMVRTMKGIRTAFIYGSYARNTEKAGSDVDLFLVGTTKSIVFDDRVQALENKYHREINYTLYSDDQYLKEKDREGSFLNLLLKEKIIVLKGEPNDR